MGLLKPDTPEPPNYAEATKEGIALDISTLPLRKMIESASRTGAKISYTDPSDGKEKTVDFTGFSDVDQSRAMLDFGIESADKLASANLELSKKYGTQQIEQRLAELKAADPTGFATRDELGKRVLDELKLGSQLDPQTQAEVVNAERGAQASRGNLLGSSSGAAEAMQVGNAGFRLKQQRLANAASFLSGTTPVAQFQGISGAQQGAVAFNPQPINQGIGVNPNAGTNGWQAAGKSFGMQMQAANMAYENSPWTKLFDTFSGILTTGAGAYAGSKFAG